MFLCVVLLCFLQLSIVISSECPREGLGAPAANMKYKLCKHYYKYSYTPNIENYMRKIDWIELADIEKEMQECDNIMSLYEKAGYFGHVFMVVYDRIYSTQHGTNIEEKILRVFKELEALKEAKKERIRQKEEEKKKAVNDACDKMSKKCKDYSGRIDEQTCEDKVEDRCWEEWGQHCYPRRPNPKGLQACEQWVERNIFDAMSSSAAKPQGDQEIPNDADIARQNCDYHREQGLKAEDYCGSVMVLCMEEFISGRIQNPQECMTAQNGCVGAFDKKCCAETDKEKVEECGKYEQTEALNKFCADYNVTSTKCTIKG